MKENINEISDLRKDLKEMDLKLDRNFRWRIGIMLYSYAHEPPNDLKG